MRVRRTFDASYLNSVANEPDVRPWLLGEGTIDLTETILNPGNYALVNDRGGFLLTASVPGIYEVHTIFRPGSSPMEFMAACQEWMFTRTDCQAITSKIPEDNRPAKGLAIKGGLGVIFRRTGCEYVELPIMKWAMNNGALEAHGERFHALIGTDHPHDEAHERAVGAAVLMIERGQAVKGVDFYNRWALLAGYAPVRLLSLSPPTVDVVDAVVGLGTNGMEVCLCR